MRSDRRRLRGDEADLFRLHFRRLVRQVQRDAGVPEAVAEDCASFAFLQLCRKQPERGPATVGWLRIVARHEAFAWLRQRCRLRVLDEEDGWGPPTPAVERIPARLDIELAHAARELLRSIAALGTHRRRALTLRAAGYSYREIQQAAGRHLHLGQPSRRRGPAGAQAGRSGRRGGGGGGGTESRMTAMPRGRMASRAHPDCRFSQGSRREYRLASPLRDTRWSSTAGADRVSARVPSSPRKRKRRSPYRADLRPLELIQGATGVHERIARQQSHRRTCLDLQRPTAHARCASQPLSSVTRPAQAWLLVEHRDPGEPRDGARERRADPQAVESPCEQWVCRESARL